MKRLWESLTGEPLALFLILGAALYTLLAFLRPAGTTETIAVSAETVRALARRDVERYLGQEWEFTKRREIQQKKINLVSLNLKQPMGVLLRIGSMGEL